MCDMSNFYFLKCLATASGTQCVAIPKVGQKIYSILLITEQEIFFFFFPL